MEVSKDSGKITEHSFNAGIFTIKEINHTHLSPVVQWNAFALRMYQQKLWTLLFWCVRIATWKPPARAKVSWITETEAKTESSSHQLHYSAGSKLHRNFMKTSDGTVQTQSTITGRQFHLKSFVRFTNLDGCVFSFHIDCLFASGSCFVLFFKFYCILFNLVTEVLVQWYEGYF